VDELAALFASATRVLTPDDDLARFEQPARGAAGRVALVVQPASVDEVREVVRLAVGEGVRLIPQGANTGLVGASVPPADEAAVVLSTDLLAGPIRVDPVAASAVIGAGTRLSALNGAAAEHGLHLAVDLSADPAIGGMIATNTGGTRVLRHGPMRDHVLGVEVVAADEGASVFGSLGGLRKDSRGLDPMQLAVGSGGTLGVISAAVVSLTRRPLSAQTWWLAVAEPRLVVELLAHLEAARPGTLSAFEYVSRAALELTLTAPGSPPNPFGTELPPAAVLAEWSFASDEPAELAGDVAAAADAGLITDGRLVDQHGGWGLRHRVTESLRHHGTLLGHDVSAPRGEALMDVRGEAAAAVEAIAPGAVLCDFGHVADGGLHLNVLIPHALGPPTPELAARLRAAIDELVLARGGSYSAEHGLGPLNAERWLAATPAVEQRIVAALKSVVDPRRILGHPRHPYNLLPAL